MMLLSATEREAERLFAIIKSGKSRDGLLPSPELTRFARLLRRCDRLKNLLHTPPVAH